MAIQTNFNKIKSDYIAKLVSTQVVVKATLDTSSDNGVILGTSADARALALEPMQGEVMVNGKVNFKTIFSSSENGIISLDYFADFTDTVKDELITPSSRLLLKLNVLDTDSTMSGQDIILTAVVEIVINEIRSEEYDALQNVEESVFSKFDTITTESLKAVSEGAFELYEEIEAGADIDKVLIYDAQIALATAKCGVNMLTITGEAYATVSFKSGADILSKSVILPFTEELDADGATPECMAVPDLFIKNKRIVLSGGKGDNVIRAEMVIGVKTPVFIKSDNKVVSDLYSCDTNLDVEDKLVINYDTVKDCCYKDKISAIAALDSGMKGIKSILTSCLARNNIANLIAQDNSITAEGLMTACVLYLDEENNPTSVKSELPYSLKFTDEDIREGDILHGYGTVSNVAVKAVSATEIEVKADIRVCVTVCRKKMGRVITRLIEGEKKDLKLNAISIYIAAGGEEMWDVVKSLSTSPEIITEQNPELKLPLIRGSRVRIYRTI